MIKKLTMNVSHNLLGEPMSWQSNQNLTSTLPPHGIVAGAPAGDSTEK